MQTGVSGASGERLAGDRLKVKGIGEETMAGELRLRIKEFSDQFGLSASQLITIIQQARLEPEKDADGFLTYSVDDIQHAYVEHQEKMRKATAEHDVEVIRRIIPEIKQAVAETAKSELHLLIAIRDNKEARLVELMGRLSQMLVSLETTSTFIVKLVAQLNNAAVAGLATRLPTVGMGGSRASYGIDQAAAKKLPSEAAHDMSQDEDGRTQHEGTELAAARSGSRPTGGGSAAGGVGGRAVASGSGGMMPSLESSMETDHAQHRAQLRAKDPHPLSVTGMKSLGVQASMAGGAGSSAGGAKGKGAKGKSGRGLPEQGEAETSGPEASTQGQAHQQEHANNWRGGHGPLFASMLPRQISISKEQEAVLAEHAAFLEEFLALSEEEMKNLASDDQGVVDLILKPWKEQVADCPKFSTFFSALSRIKEWISAKSRTVPPLIVFLALNRNSPGNVAPTNFMFLTGLNDLYR